jgi:hypothetical protein
VCEPHQDPGYAYMQAIEAEAVPPPAHDTAPQPVGNYGDPIGAGDPLTGLWEHLRRNHRWRR